MAKPRITILGLGRIGSSMGLALKKAEAQVEIVGHDKDSKTAQSAQKRGAVDRTDWNLINACDGAGLIVLALPLTAIQETLDILRNELPAGVIVTDTAASKVPVLEWAKALPSGVNFVGGDPILPPTLSDRVDATGADAADADLFQGAAYCLTPSASTDPAAVQAVTGLVTLLGAKPLFIDAREHDGLVAGAQHLAYILAATLLQATTTSGGWREMSRFAGSDFRQVTELASRDPASQRAILLSHSSDLIRWIDVSIDTLKQIRVALASGDSSTLEQLLSQVVAARSEWLAGQVRTEPPPVVTEVSSGPFERMLLGGLALRGTRKK